MCVALATAIPASASPTRTAAIAPEGKGKAGADGEPEAKAPSGLHAPRSRFHVDLGLGSGRLDLGGGEPTNSAAFDVGAAVTLTPTLQATLSTRALDYGRGTEDRYRSIANLEIGLRWSPFGRYRSSGTAVVLDHVQVEAGIGLARSSLGSWQGLNPFDQEDRRFGLGFSAGVRWLPIVSESFAAGLGAWFLGQVMDGERRDAAMAGFTLELGR
jgi:hypothetical protein